VAVVDQKIQVASYWRVARKASARLSWGVADQAMGALSNVLLSVYIARTLGASQFGAFSLAYVTYGFAINASRGLSVEPLLVRFSGTSLATWRRAVAGCTGTALLVGTVLGVFALAAGVLLGGASGLAFLALGLTLPGLMLQDSWRHSFFAVGRAHHAFINDTIWTAIQIPLIVGLKISGHANVFWFVFAWGLSACIAAAVGPLQARVLPNLTSAKAWLSRHRDLGPRYLVENTGGNVASTVQSYSASYILGIAAVGYIQASNTLMGPFKLLFYGMNLITIPEAARILRRSPRHLPLFSAVLSVALALLALAWGLVLLVAMPRGLGHLMLGSIWRPTYPLVLPTTLSVMSLCATTGPVVGLHALGAARRSLRAALFASAAILVAALVGALTQGTIGTVRDAAFASWLGTVVAWWQYRQALQESPITSVPVWLWPDHSVAKHRFPPSISRYRHRRAQTVITKETERASDKPLSDAPGPRSGMSLSADAGPCPPSAARPGRRCRPRHCASSTRSPSAWTARSGSIPPVPTPAAASGTIRSRCAGLAGIDGARSHRASSARSDSGNSTTAFKRHNRANREVGYFVHRTLEARPTDEDILHGE
jgi:O-antigen/teichoic acid export membrane protein